MKKIAITGVVKSGKTHLGAHFLANSLTPEEQKDLKKYSIRRETDALIGKLAWGKDSEEVAKWFDEERDPNCQQVIYEGATIVRALRKWLAGHPEGKPVDQVIYLTKPLEDLVGPQAASSKAQNTIWAEIKAELIARGVEVVEKQFTDFLPVVLPQQ